MASEEDEKPRVDSAKSRACALLSTKNARSVLEQFLEKKADDKDGSTSIMPVKEIKAIKSLIKKSKDSDGANELHQKLLETIKKSRFAYTPPPPKSEAENSEREKFKKRLERLREKQEENRYRKITTNIGTKVEDDITVKSMSYAASVGMNMIVAPISFGVFMYFFSGQIFSWGIEEDDKPLVPGKVDIKRVITAVISGVLMLFIEMILFVIRSHEFDEHMRKKQKKNKPTPFHRVGERTYDGP